MVFSLSSGAFAAGKQKKDCSPSLLSVDPETIARAMSQAAQKVRLSAAYQKLMNAAEASFSTLKNPQERAAALHILLQKTFEEGRNVEYPPEDYAVLLEIALEQFSEVLPESQSNVGPYRLPHTAPTDAVQIQNHRTIEIHLTLIHSIATRMAHAQVELQKGRRFAKIAGVFVPVIYLLCVAIVKSMNLFSEDVPLQWLMPMIPTVVAPPLLAFIVTNYTTPQAENINSRFNEALEQILQTIEAPRGGETEIRLRQYLQQGDVRAASELLTQMPPVPTRIQLDQTDVSPKNIAVDEDAEILPQDTPGAMKK